MNRPIALHLVRLALVGLPLALGGCTPESPSAEALGVARAPVSAPVRQVSVRSPFGDVAATGNLVLDGDLEFEQGSYARAWYGFNADGSIGEITYQSGGQCRSGLYCGDAPVGQSLYAEYVAIGPGTAGTFTFAARPASGACGDVHGELDLGLDGLGLVYDAFVAQPASASPGSDGWCTYTAHYTADQPLYQWTQIGLWSASETVFDDVVAVEAPEVRELAERERRAGEPEKGRLLVAQRRAALEAGARRTPEILKGRRGLSRATRPAAR
jgi:hypothetical protein